MLLNPFELFAATIEIKVQSLYIALVLSEIQASR